MQILELQIKNFGKFKNQVIRFHDGLNILYGKNESGKTTIHSFIKGMLFGIEKQRGRASKNDEYKLREPWDNPGYFAGVMRFESGGKIFRLERNFNKREKTAGLICETDGEELSIEDGDLDVLLEGLNETAFSNTIFIRQMGSATDEGLALEVKNYMGNLQNAGDSEINAAQAIEELERKKRQIEAERKKETKAEEDRMQELQLRMEYVQREIRQVEEEEQEGIRNLNYLEAELSQVEYSLLQRKKETGERKDTFEKKQRIFLAVGALAVLLAMVIPYFWIKAVAGILFCITVGMAIWLHQKDMKEQEADQEAEMDLYEREQEETRDSTYTEKQRQQWRLEQIRESKKEKQTVWTNLKESLEELQEESTKSLLLEKEVQALQLAIDTIQDSSKELYKRSARELNERVSQILSEITQGKYTSVFLDSEMQVRINTPEKLLDIWQVSRGTMDQIYFALRMAAGEMLCKEEPVPVILDDAFAMYDDERLLQTLKWLKGSGRQILLFTCHKREQELLSQ